MFDLHPKTKARMASKGGFEESHSHGISRPHIHINPQNEKYLVIRFWPEISLKRYLFPETLDFFLKVFTTGETKMLLSDHGITK